MQIMPGLTPIKQSVSSSFSLPLYLTCLQCPHQIHPAQMYELLNPWNSFQIPHCQYVPSTNSNIPHLSPHSRKPLVTQQISEENLWHSAILSSFYAHQSYTSVIFSETGTWKIKEMLCFKCWRRQGGRPLTGYTIPGAMQPGAAVAPTKAPLVRVPLPLPRTAWTAADTAVFTTPFAY